MPKLTTDLLQQEIDYAVVNDDAAGAFEAYQLVKDWLDKNNMATAAPAEYARYFEYLIKLKFLCLNYFDDVNEYYDLLKNYFPLSQDMPGFDLWSRVDVQLISMKSLAERDAFKFKLKDALEKSDSLLISRQRYGDDAEMPHKVGEWVKNFVANLGLESFDKLKKMEYVSNGRYIKILEEKDRTKVRNLLDIYEKFMMSSRSPQGYENSVIINIDGRTAIFNRGEIENVNIAPSQNIKTEDKVVGAARLTTPPSVRSVSASAAISQPATPDASGPTIVDLESALKNYAAGSLEHKAIKQEISRLKLAEFKQAQRSAGNQSDAQK
jgi:hypothetical protein